MSESLCISGRHAFFDMSTAKDVEITSGRNGYRHPLNVLARDMDTTVVVRPGFKSRISREIHGVSFQFLHYLEPHPQLPSYIPSYVASKNNNRVDAKVGSIARGSVWCWARAFRWWYEVAWLIKVLCVWPLEKGIVNSDDDYRLIGFRRHAKKSCLVVVCHRLNWSLIILTVVRSNHLSLTRRFLLHDSPYNGRSLIVCCAVISFVLLLLPFEQNNTISMISKSQ